MVYWNEPRPLNYEKPKFHQSKLCWKGSCVLKSVFWSRRSTSRLQTSVCDPSKTRAQTAAYLHDETWELSATVTQKPKECEGQWTQLDRWTVYPGTHRLACFFTFPSAQPACVFGCGHILLRSCLHNKSRPVTGVCQNVECMSQSMKYLIDDAFLIRRTWCEYMFLCCSIRKN